MTREELFDLIWAEPAVVVARRLGVSGSYLARVCTALEVPRPSSGYWAKRAVGRAPPPPCLPSSSPGNPSSWSRDKSERVVIKPFYQAACLYRRADDREAEHPLVGLTRLRFEVAAVRTDDIDDYLRLPNRSYRLDVTASRGGLATALAFGDSLFKALEDRGHQVVIAGGFQKLARILIDGDEKSREDFLVAARRPTVVYVGTIPIGLAIIEIKTAKKMQYAGYGKFVPAEEWKGRHVGYTWSTVKEMPSGRIKLVAYDPSRRAGWRQEWQESKTGQLAGRVDEIARRVERAAKMLAAIE